MEETKRQKQNRLSLVRQTYNEVSLSIAHGNGVPPLKRTPRVEMVPLSIKSDVKKYIQQSNRSYMLKSQRISQRAIRDHLRAADIRVQKASLGISLDRVLRSTSPPATARSPFVCRSDYNCATPSDARNKSNYYCYIPPIYIVPDEVVSGSISARKENDLNKIKFKIFEQNMRQSSDFLRQLNTREANRAQTMEQRYKDYIESGIKISSRKARKLEAINEFRGARPDLGWWDEFLDGFSLDEKGNTDLACLEGLSKCILFNEYGLAKVYENCPNKSKKARDTFKSIILNANRLGNFVSEATIKLHLQEIDEKVSKAL